MSDATPEEDKARELEEMYDFFHGPDVTDEVVAKAIEKCVKYIKIADEQVVYHKGAMLNNARGDHDEKYLIAVQNRTAWQTHLDEFEEHQLKAVSWSEGVITGWGCFKCETYEPCDFAVTKAKRLLGEEL